MNMIFRKESRDGPSGQSNLRLIAEVNGSVVGRIDYVLYQGKPSINMVEVQQNSHRNGYGSALVYQLQREFPSQEIDWGMLTSDGAKLFASLPKQFVKDSEYGAKRDLYVANIEKLVEYSRLAEVFHAIEKPTDAERSTFELVTGDWNDLSDMQWDLEQYFEATPPGKTLLVHSPNASWITQENQQRQAPPG